MEKFAVLQAELCLFSSGEPSSEHAIGAPGDSYVMTSKPLNLELREELLSNIKLINGQQIFVYLLTGEKTNEQMNKTPYPKFLKARLCKKSQWFQRACPKTAYSNGIYNM